VEPGCIDFTTWYAEERDGLVRSLLVIGGDAEVARDAVAEAFSRAYERWGRVSAMRSPTGWVYRVALHEIRRRERRRRIEARLLRRRAEPPPTIPPPEVDPELWAAVAGLPRREREVVVLRYVADLREREVGEVLGISEGAASAALVAARRRLAQALEPSGTPGSARQPRPTTEATAP
jgi:RNA polymerase sigma-70 factor, ECF subfamily